MTIASAFMTKICAAVLPKCQSERERRKRKKRSCNLANGRSGADLDNIASVGLSSSIKQQHLAAAFQHLINQY